MSKKAWIIFVALCVALLGGLVYVSNKSKVDVSTINENSILGAKESSGNIADHVFGKKDSKVVLVEYGDFQCPGCGSAHPKVKAVTEKYKGQMAFVFRNFPITSAHPNAKAAAAAAEAAGLQGKYWEMHNQLFENQQSWSTLSANDRTSFFTNYAKSLGLKPDQFTSDLSDARISQKINFDQAVAKKHNVNSTPTFYLNGKPVESEVWSDQEKFEKAVVDELKAKGIELPAES